ncbi:MAG: NAD-dependent epimerase/dehydratase family protein [Desulfobulbaceae bacterium]|nr:NAD-dependent epimerase/dehydratase family protein [Desulfobulbaceae bacterium]
MRCLVTGGTGFVGSNIALALQEQGHEVLITGNESEQPVPQFIGKCLYPGFLGIDFDAIGKIDVLFHQAAINGTRVSDEKEIMRANYYASKRLFEYVLENGCKKIIYATSTAVYGNNPAPYKENDRLNPQTPYAESKVLLEEYATALANSNQDVTLVGLRYCNIYGPRENHKGTRATMIYQFAQQMLKGNPKLFKYGEQKRDYIYVKDVVQANLLAAASDSSCIVNCGSGKATSFNKLVSMLNALLGIARTPEFIDNPFVESYQDYTECDMTMARERIRFVPAYSIEEGLMDYFKSGFLV